MSFDSLASAKVIAKRLSPWLPSLHCARSCRLNTISMFTQVKRAASWGMKVRRNEMGIRRLTQFMVVRREFGDLAQVNWIKLTVRLENQKASELPTGLWLDSKSSRFRNAVHRPKLL